MKTLLTLAFSILMVGNTFAQVVSAKDSVIHYHRLAKYSKALEFAEPWVKEAEKTASKNPLGLGTALLWKGACLVETAKKSDSDTVLQKALAILHKIPDTDSLVGMGELYTAKLKSDIDMVHAEEHFKKAISLLSSSLGELHYKVINAYIEFGNFATEATLTAEAEALYLKALELQIRLQGEEHPRTAQILSNVAWYYSAIDNHDKGLTYYQRSVSILRKQVPVDKVALARTLTHLAYMYNDMGNFTLAEETLMEALELEKSRVPVNPKALADKFRALGYHYQERGDLVKAERNYLKCIELRRTLPRPEQELIPILQNVGNLYKDLGDYEKAEKYYRECYQDRLEILKTHASLGYSYTHMAILAEHKKQYQEAEKWRWKTFEIYEKNYASYPYVGGKALRYLALFYTNRGKFHLADSLLTEVDRRYHASEMLGEQNEWDYLSASRQNWLLQTGNYPMVCDLALKSYQKNVARYGPKSQAAGDFAYTLAFAWWQRGNETEAEKWYIKLREIIGYQLEQILPYLSDYQRVSYWNSVSDDVGQFSSFCVARAARSPGILGHLYNSRLVTKSLLLNSSAKWKHRIKESHDKKLLNLYNLWEENQNRVIQLEQETDSAKRAALDTLRPKTEKLEKELSTRSEHFASLADKRQYTWQDVQKKLKPGEAAVEMIRLNKYGVVRVGTDSSDPKRTKYNLKGRTDTIYYAALIVKTGLVHPELVILKNGNQMEAQDENYYRNCIQKKIRDERSYNRFWKKIEQKLGPSIRHVYFSPDGVYHFINLQTLFDPATKKYLIEGKNIDVVTSTKDLVIPGKEEPENKLAYLVGFPNYNIQLATSGKSGAERGNGPMASYRLETNQTEAYGELPGTKTELEGIEGILKTNGWEVQTLTGGLALEEALKESFKPRVLHIATHGYFKPDSTSGYNPLLRSGLLLAGANQSIFGARPESGDDGILTAYEAMNLNLDNTDLVVLSACETGLGEIKNGEGVYGLQRAFKVAGARSIIMSLWKVDDEATQELMVSFYKHWLSAAGGNKRSAFLKAQKELKAKYPNPYYWGAFVMVGE